MLDGSKIGANNASLNLDALLASLLGDLLSNALAVSAAEDLGPCELARVFALEEQRLFLGSDEAVDSAVDADIKLALYGMVLNFCGRQRIAAKAQLT